MHNPLVYLKRKANSQAFLGKLTYITFTNKFQFKLMTQHETIAFKSFLSRARTKQREIFDREMGNKACLFTERM